MNTFQKIIITNIDRTVSRYREGTLEFEAVSELFECLSDLKAPDDSVRDSREFNDVLHHVNKYDIREIKFLNFRKYKFIKRNIDGLDGFLVECEELRPDLESMLEALRGNPNIKIMGGTFKDLEDLEAKVGDELPEPLREIINYVKRVMADQTAEVNEQHIHQASTIQH